MPEYVTVLGSTEAEIEIKRSRFLATVAHIDDEAAARAVIEHARSVHWDARHHCSAFIVGTDSAISRSSDDGEPSGTAGMPMLEVLRGEQLTFTVAVVTRWFGGILLGTGGLVRAYSEAVRAALDAAPRQHMVLQQLHTIDVPIATAPSVEQGLRHKGFTVIDATWSENVLLTVAISPHKLDELISLCAQLTSGRTIPVFCGETWVPDHDCCQSGEKRLTVVPHKPTSLGSVDCIKPSAPR